MIQGTHIKAPNNKKKTGKIWCYDGQIKVSLNGLDPACMLCLGRRNRAQGPPEFRRGARFQEGKVPREGLS